MNRRAVRAASTMCRTRMQSSGGILDLRGFHDRASEVTAQILRGAEIHTPSADQVGQPGFKFAQCDETRLPPWLEFHQQVDGAVRSRRSPQGGAEQGQPADMKAPAYRRQGGAIGEQAIRQFATLLIPGSVPGALQGASCTENMSQASPDCRPQGFIFANANDPPEAITRRIEGLNSHSAEFFGQASKSRRLSSGMRGPLSNANGFPRRLEDNLLLASPCAPGKIRAQWRDGMSAPARTHDRRYTIEEFEAMDFGGLPAELIDGLVTVAHALPTDEHGIIVENLGHL
jgi:hypothetical protein